MGAANLGLYMTTYVLGNNMFLSYDVAVIQWLMTCNKYDTCMTMRYTTLSRKLGLNIFYLYTLYKGQHIKTYITMKVYK